MGIAVVALAAFGAFFIVYGHTHAAIGAFVAIAAMVPFGRAREWWADRRRERNWRAGKRCAYCRMDLGVTVYVCGHTVCRDMHELAAGCEPHERAS